MAHYRNFVKRILFLTSFLIVSALTLCIFRAILVEKPIPVDVCATDDSDFISDSNRGLSDKFAASLRFKSITYAPGKYEKDALAQLAKFISSSFPRVHSTPFITKEVINNLSLLYTVKGSDQNLKPYLLAGHLDVVPVEEKEWEEPPFDGVVKDGYIWGRGSIDCKHIVMGVLEALEFLLERGFQPRRSFYLAFGHDEEGGGYDGAAHIGQILIVRGVQLEYLLDEGSFVLKKIVPGVQNPIALVGVTEKGSMNLELMVKTTPGHSSIPPKDNAIVILSEALAKLHSTVFPSMIGKGPEHIFFESLAPYANFPYKLVYSNLWLFKPIISWRMSSNHILNALIRTTTAVTLVSGGLKENISPSSATATVNHRVHPAQTVSEAFEYVKYIINDERVHIKILSSFEAHPLSPFSETTFGFMMLKKSIHQIFPDTCVAPVTLVGNTDTRWYLNLTTAIYRFSPVNMFSHETTRFHGHNERISVENYIQLVNFYFHLIKNSNEDKLISKQRQVDEL